MLKSDISLSFKTLEWKNNALVLLDQTKLPTQEEYIICDKVEHVYDSIKRLSVRGAPAIGIAAAYGLYLGIRNVNIEGYENFLEHLQKVQNYLAQARPTAVNLFWSMEEIMKKIKQQREKSILDLKKYVLSCAIYLHEDDEQRCFMIGKYGSDVISNNMRVLTHCNTGALATGGMGTALSVIIHAHAIKENIFVWVDETRPLLQGSRLTSWELTKMNISHNIVVDSAAALLMSQNKVDIIITGADRIAGNGDSANKIGTCGLAILAHYFKIPFYIAAPLSTIDINTNEGIDIPIENRSEKEITHIHNQQITINDAIAYNPAFDITPHHLITGIITEKGIVTDNYNKVFKNMLLK